MNEIVILAKEDWNRRLGLNARQRKYRENFERGREFIFGKQRLQHGGMAFRPLSGDHAASRDEIFPAANFELVTLLPVRNHYGSPNIRRPKRYRLAMSRLRFGVDEAGNPAYLPMDERGKELTDWDFAKSPRRPELVCEECVFAPDSLGGRIAEAQTGIAEKVLTATADGQLQLLRNEVWVDIVVRPNARQRSEAIVIYRFPAAEFDHAVKPIHGKRRVLQRNVRFGDPVCTLSSKAVYYKARIRGGRNVFRQERPRDRLLLSAAGHSKEDYLCDIGNRLWSDILNCEGEVEAARPLVHSFPVFLGHFNVPFDEFSDLPGWEGIPAAAAREIRKGVSALADRPLYYRAKGIATPEGSAIIGGPLTIENNLDAVVYTLQDGSQLRVPACAVLFGEVAAGKRIIQNGDPIADLVPRANYEDIGDVLRACNNDPLPLFHAFLESVAVHHCPDWRREGFLLDRKYIPETMLPQVQGWYLDFRDTFAELDPNLGGFLLPPFPREAETEFVFTVNGVFIDATPSMRWFKSNRQATEMPAAMKATEMPAAMMRPNGRRQVGITPAQLIAKPSLVSRR
jgi:hypothetical protein